MGFKKKKDLKKKAKKGKRKPVDREWSHEGGASFNDEVQHASAKKAARRETQDRDERIRRGRAKIDYAKSKRESLKKMKRGICFKDVVGDSEPAIEQEEVKIKPEHVQFKSSLSVLSRLTNMVTSSMAPNAAEASTDEEQGDEDREDGADAELPEDSNRKLRSSSDDSFISDLVTPLSDRFGWFFDSSVSAESDSSPGATAYSPLCTHMGLTVLEQLHESFDKSALISSRCQSWGDIPGLHKMWRGRGTEPLDKFSKVFLPYLLTYGDVFLDGCDHSNWINVETAMSIHIAQHVIRSRAIMQKNSEKLKKKKLKTEIKQTKQRKNALAKSVGALDDDGVDDAVDDLYESADEEIAETRPRRKTEDQSNAEQDVEDASILDQGYTRPRVLILCPFRSTARRIVQGLISALGEDITSVTGLDKFKEEFSAPDELSDEADVGAVKKPSDWKAIFNDNTDDDFKMGIQITPGQGKGSGVSKGAHVRLFSDFFLSDLIIASPLGLRLVVTGKDNLTFDFLSSIEVVYMHQADIMYMQNWDHVTHVFDHINLTPKQNHDTDFSRIRPYFLEGRGSKHCQFVLCSQFNDPLIWSLFRTYGKSVAGHVRFKANWGDVGCLGAVTASVQQIFQLIPCLDTSQLETTRFEYFKKNILGPMLRLNQSRTLIVTPSYFSYVKVRNELIRSEASAAFICEYSRESEISRGRSRFFNGNKNIMLYSGRAHFFWRLLIRGARHIVFYSLPEYAHFYPELVNLLQGDLSGEEKAEGFVSDKSSSGISCTVLLTRYDAMALERIVGTKRCQHMLSSSSKSTFMFC